MRKLLISFIILFSMFSLYSVASRVYDGTYLIKETDEDGCSYAYTYLDGLLLFTSIEDQTGNISVEYYLRDPVDFRLIAVKRGESISVSDSGLPYKGNFTTDEEGRIVYIEDNSVYKYSASGLLLSEEKGGVLTEYVYDEDSVLTSIIIRTDTEVRKEYYKKGKLISYEKYENSIIMETGLYSNDGLVKTIYNRGKAIARILYATDLVKVVKVEYL